MIVSHYIFQFTETDVSAADRVTSAIDSITFEEQLDKMEADKKIILQEKEDAIQENKSLLAKLEQVMREKQEISLKLEHYMQENMDLIDKLEKMSAEKVSSAESIEIVEGLTQQEKLELEAYQKNLDFVKGSQENLEQNAELNESVNQLTEETSELLQKIELFTIERREVMEKMETLTQENIQLNTKVKEIENNRDVLAETYEQLQNEKETLDRKLQKLEDDYTILSDKHKMLQEENEGLRSGTVLQNDLQNRIFELEEQLERKEAEILNLKSLIDTTKTEANQEIAHLNSVIDDLNDALNKLENENKNVANKIEAVESLEKQLDELKQLFNENIQQTQCYENEIADNTKQLNQLSESLSQMEFDLHSKDDEIKKLLKDKANLQEELKTKNENFRTTFEELKGKYEKMVTQIDQNADCLENIKKPLEEKIDDLMNKNKEQLEKMKKIAANLKKKSSAYQELEKKYVEISEKWEHENREKEDFREAMERKDLQILEMNQKIKSLVQQLHEVEDELSATQNRLVEKEKEFNSVLERKEIKVQEELQTVLRQYEDRIATLVHENEVLRDSKKHSKEEEEIKQLNQELEQLKYNSTTHSNALQSKIQELEMFIENQDAELTAYKERISKLEDCLNTVEERRVLLEEKTLELGAQLQEKSNSIEEISNTEDELEKRLNALIARDDAIQKRFRTTMDENSELIEQNRLLNEHIDELKHKITLAHNKVTELTVNTENLLKTEHENVTLKERICELENHLKRMQTELNQNKKEMDINESDAQEQLNILNEERREFLKQIEKLSDRLKEFELQELNSGQNIQEDVMKLKQIISDKEKEIEEYQKQNLQLQMQSSFGPVLDDVSNDTKVQLQDALNKIVELQDVIEKYTVELSEKHIEISTLSNQLKSLQEQEPPQIKTFSWPQETDGSESTAEELQKKIKALEFMLYNVEKEKDEAIVQCHQLSNELTRLVYEREQVAPTDQILSNVDLIDTPESLAKLHNIEFEPTKPIQKRENDDQQQPVIEEVLTPKTAYLCYGDDEIASQIVKKEEDSIESQKRLHELEFEKVKPIVCSKTDLTQSVVDEDKVEAKTAYLCYDKKSDNVDVFGENDDGWAWGPEEVQLEEEHQSENIPQQSTFAAQIQQLTEKIKILEVERENHLEEIKQAQIKSGKLIKKLKELKSKNDQLSSNQIAAQSSNLDDTIQDEFKLQIVNLDKKIKELTADLAKERLEKENLKKRIDVLTAANDRMIEMKERQEIEIISWQQRNLELENKLSQFNWGHDDDFEPTDKPKSNNVEQLQKRIEELNGTIRELSLDNEELQALLEEQRNLRIVAEKSKYATTDDSVPSLEEQLSMAVEEKKKLQEELNVFIQKTDVLAMELEQLSRVKEKLEILASEKNELEKKCEHIKFQYDSLIRESVELNHEVLDKLEANNRLIGELNEEKALLNNQLQQKETEIIQLNDTFNKQISHLRTELNERDETIRQLEAENERLNEKNKNDSVEYEMKLSKTIDDLQREWMQQVDQRGNDVAESWKLHLETRENEFMRIEQQLRRDIYVLEEKCNSLVNENNELRKNVDAEIRNEVDRVAALQQQINDKQNEINELNKILQEKEGVIENIQGQLALALESVTQLQEQIQDNELKITDYETTLSIKNEELVRNEQLLNTTATKHEELQKLLEDRETKLHALQSELIEKQTALTQSDDYKSKFEQLEQEFDNRNVLIAELYEKLNHLQMDSKTIAELQGRIDNLNGSLQEKQNNLTSLSNDLQHYQQLVQTHESTINRLNAYIEEVKQEFVVKSTEMEQIINEKLQEINILNRKLTETTDHYNETLSDKDAQLESLKLQLERYNDENKKLQEISSELKSKFEEQTSDLHKIIEDQVLKIEQLKKELFEKSNDYDALVAELDMHHQKKQDDREKYQAPPSVYHETEEDNLLEPVSRAELDLALYMLHQRDVRCEELTVELMQLLEERDTLQLRLSNAIREKEQMKNVTETNTSSITGAIPKSRTSDIVLRATGTELAKEAVESQLDPLAHK